MAVAEGKVRIQITLSSVLLDQIDEFCKASGATRSAFISTSVAERLNAYNTMLGSSVQVLKSLTDSQAAMAALTELQQSEE